MYSIYVSYKCIITDIYIVSSYIVEAAAFTKPYQTKPNQPYQPTILNHTKPNRTNHTNQPSSTIPNQTEPTIPTNHPQPYQTKPNQITHTIYSISVCLRLFEAVLSDFCSFAPPTPPHRYTSTLYPTPRFFIFLFLYLTTRLPHILHLKNFYFKNIFLSCYIRLKIFLF
jgi:hypothetical protein